MSLKHYIGLVVIVLLGGCKGKFTSFNAQGTIEYEITYLQMANGGFDASLLPRKLILDYTGTSCVNTIQGFMGVFQLRTYVDFYRRKAKTHLKVFDKHYYYEGSRNELMCCFDAMEGMQVEIDTNSVHIAGLRSHKATVSLPDADSTFEVYYTNDISLPSPNANNPYSQIDGVLTKFRLLANGYVMDFEAVSFSSNPEQKREKKIPEDIKEVNRAELTYIFNRLLTSS